MKNLLSCAFNMDSGAVELRYSDGTMLAIDCTAVDMSFDTTIRSRSELDWLIDNDPLAYAELVLNGDVCSYLKRVTSENDGLTANR